MEVGLDAEVRQEGETGLTLALPSNVEEVTKAVEGAYREPVIPMMAERRMEPPTKGRMHRREG